MVFSLLSGGVSASDHHCVARGAFLSVTGLPRGMRNLQAATGAYAYSAGPGGWSAALSLSPSATAASGSSSVTLWHVRHLSFLVSLPCPARALCHPAPASVDDARSSPASGTRPRQSRHRQRQRAPLRRRHRSGGSREPPRPAGPSPEAGISLRRSARRRPARIPRQPLPGDSQPRAPRSGEPSPRRRRRPPAPACGRRRRPD